MCGIAGVVGDRDSARASEAVRRMVADLRRRGPDAEGIEIWDRAVLGHRRLSIFDLSRAGHQPMVSLDRSVAVVFNGAIYNFPELRGELVTRGYTFRSGTDTEVLIHGYREWGLDRLLERLRGMFSFALWDDTARILYLVRDRLGVKPLLYNCEAGIISFASTARALSRGMGSGEIDENAVGEFLEFGFITDARSIYRGVHKVPAASIVEWKDGGIRERIYWSPPPARAAGSVTFADAVEQTEGLFLKAVERRLHADVPVGALLSGGVDSGLVCWAIAALGGDVTAFTVSTPGDPGDETEDASATAQALGIRHQVVEAASEFPEIEELVSAYGEPFACASALGMLRVSRAVTASAKVLLTGDGGDDVFLGYPRHRHLWIAQKLARVIPAAAAKSWYRLRRVMPRVGTLRRATHFLDYATGGLGAFINANDGLPMYRRNGLLGERLAAGSVDQRAIPWSLASARRVLEEYLEYDRRTQFVAEYMTKVDGATMHYAIEARSPFLDQDLWEYAASLPYDLRLHRGQLKAVLREIARRRVGQRIAVGRKRGFAIPVRRWMANRWRGTVESAFNDSALAEGGWIRSQAVLRYFHASLSEGEVPLQLWYLFVLESWLRAEQSRVGTEYSEAQLQPAPQGS